MIPEAVGTSSRLSVTFYGAAHAVTGSMHLVEAAGRKVLLDCGLLRTPGHDFSPYRGHFPFLPAEIDAVVLTHAHMDHCGALPLLVRQGFAGPIYCTAATRDLVGLVLANAGRIHEEVTFVESVVGRPVDERAPHYSRADARRTLDQCVALPYGHEHALGPDIAFRLADAGHVLGSAMIALRAGGLRGGASLTFTGDLGRPGTPLLPDPAPVPDADVLLSECTNGDRVLESLAETAARLEELVRQTVERGGKVLIPAFSLGRTQLLLHYLEEAVVQGRIPAVPVFVDSPLAADIARVYRQHPECLRSGARIPNGAAEDGEPAATLVRYVRTHEEHVDLSSRREPCVILAPSGMCQGGRIVRHIKENIDDPRSTILLVSYQAPHTLGRRLLQPGPAVRFHGKKWNRWADVVKLAGFSGHPDQSELRSYLKPLAERGPKIRLVHGEVGAAETLAATLRAEGFADVEVPDRGERVSLG